MLLTLVFLPICFSMFLYLIEARHFKRVIMALQLVMFFL